MNDMMIAYPNTRPMCSANCDGAAAAVVVSGEKLQDALARAAAPRGQGVGVGAHLRPVAGGLPGPPRRQHAHPQRGQARPTSRRASARRTSTWSSCTTASPPPSSCTTTTSMLCEEGGAVDFFNSGAPWRDGSHAGQRVGRPAVEGPPDRGDRHRQHLGDLPPPPRRGRRPPDRGRQGRPRPRHRPRLGLRHPHPREVRRLTTRCHDWCPGTV